MLNVISLRIKLIATFLILSTLTIITVAFISSRSATRTLDEIIGEQLHDLAASRAHAVGDLSIQQVNIVEALSLNATLRTAASAANDGRTGDAAAIRAELESLDRQWLAARDHDPLIQATLDTPLAHACPLTHLGGRPIGGLLTAPPHGVWHDLSVIVMRGHPLSPETGIRITDNIRDWMQKPPGLERLAEVLAQTLAGT